MDELGPLLRKLRNEAGMSLNDVYEKCGISDSKLSRIEQGRNSSETSPGILRKLAKLYNVNLTYLYLAAGYLDDKELPSHESIFSRTEFLNDDERQLIQNLIDLFTKGRG